MRLVIYFGAAPGIGKTSAMLAAARQAAGAGRDVVAGVVESGDPAGLEVLPRRRDGLDVEAALARKPSVLLVDELARANPPGSRHVARWRDVLELVDAGVEVWTTLDVAQIESLGDVIQQITGAPVRETVPDHVVDRAELRFVDAPVEGHLVALRELALRRAAERVGAEVIAHRREHGIAATWPTRDRILVCVGPSPASARLIRAAKRMAEGLRAPWIAATVEVIGAPPPSTRDRERLAEHLTLAEQLGGTVVRLSGHAIADALLAHAREHNVTRIVAGKPTHSKWRDRLRGSLLDELIRGSGPIEVHVIAPLEPREAPPARPRIAERRGLAPYAWAVAGIAAATAIGLAAFRYITLADITMLYLIAIMVVSLGGRGPSLLAASLAVAAFDVCFVPPRFTFVVHDVRHVLTFGVMFASGLAIATLMSRVRGQQRDAEQRERRTAALLAFTREVAAASDETEVAVVAARHLEDGLDAAAAVMVADRDGQPVAAAGLTAVAGTDAAAARWAFEHRQVAGHGTPTMPDARVLAVPLVDGDSAIGVIALQRRKGAPVFDADQHQLLEALGRQTALALNRVRLAAQAKEAALRARTEELRSSLLSAVSHDLRTPLSVITGAATSLRDDADKLPPAARAELLSTIVDDAQRLERMLANLLQLTRVETGLVPAREWVPADEVVGAALVRVEDALEGSAVDVDVPPDVLLWIDPVLFEQVLINLVDNALKHGSPPLSIAVRATDEQVTIDVADRGPGVPAESQRLFEKFVRASPSPGVGLGLAVVRAIVTAHGGQVTAEPRPGGGAVFRIVLPRGTPPQAAVERVA